MTQKQDDLAGTPLLVLIHGTGSQKHCEDGADLARNFDSAYCDEWDHDKLWWQSDSSLCRRLAERIRTKDGRSLTEAGLVFRLKWDGQNKETARDRAADLFETMFERYGPRRIHVIAHSHGGNVVRTAIEQLARRKQDLTRIGTVVSMGTPFFRYSRSAWHISVATRAALTVLFAWLFELLVSTHDAGGGFAAAGLQKWMLYPAAIACMLLTIGAGYLLYQRLSDRPRKGRKTGPPIRWTNLCASNDEAIQLLMSLNKPVKMLSRSSGQRPPGWLRIALLLMGVGMSFTIMSVAIYYFGLPISDEEWVFDVACLALGYVLYRLFLIIRQLLKTGTTTALDRIVFSRLRALAFGDDDGDGINAVAYRPWPPDDDPKPDDEGKPDNDRKDPYVELPDEIEIELEAQIKKATSGMWGKVRMAMKADATFLDVNFRYLVEEVLTGDELAHTVYYRVDSIVDLIADDLVKSKDYVRCEAAPAS